MNQLARVRADMVRLPLERPDLFVAVDFAVMFSFNLHHSVDHPRVCVGCGCTDEMACPGGCAWVPNCEVTLCTACVGDGLVPP